MKRSIRHMAGTVAISVVWLLASPFVILAWIGIGSYYLCRQVEKMEARMRKSERS